MTTVNHRGKLGRYIHNILTTTDFILLNVILYITYRIYPDILDEHSRIIVFLFNVSFIPGALWVSDIHRQRAVYMDHIILRAIQMLGVHAAIFLCLIFLLNIEDFPAKGLLLFYVLLISAFIIWWSLARQILKHYRKRGLNFVRAIIVGTNATARRLHEEIQSDAGYGYNILGFFDDDKSPNFSGKYLGKIDEIESFVKAKSVDEIFYALSGENENALRSVIKIADDNVVQFYYVPQLSRYINRRFDMYNMGQVPVLTLRRNPLKGGINRVIKRMFDIVFSSFVLLLSPIIFIPVAIAIKISSPGPIFFKQKRTGYRGCDFYCWKFRTMKVNADSDKKQAQKDDPRKTKVGDFLRKTSIDELPQFINVFLGDMSIVGPRPHMLKHTQDYSQLIDKYMIRHFIKPGITGWAQVNGYRGLTEELWQMEKRVEYDVWYIENWTFLLDLKIIARTVINAIHGEKNAF